MSFDQTAILNAIFGPKRDVPTEIRGNTTQSAHTRLDIHRNNVTTSLSGALETGFPMLRKLLGRDKFKDLAIAYLRKHPPNSPAMIFYGNEMPDFLIRYRTTCGIKYLPDVARFELACRQSYHAADATAVRIDTVEAYLSQSLDNAYIQLSPASRVLESSWPIFSIWRFHVDASAPSPTMIAEDVLITRPVFDVIPKLLPKGGSKFIKSLQDGTCFGQATDEAMNCNEAFDLEKTLRLLIEAHAITSVGL